MFEDIEFARFQEAERKDHLVEIKQLLHELNSKGRIDIMEV